MKTVDIIFKLLMNHYPVNKFKEHGDENPFQVLISCILSLRTKDEVTYVASKKLFKVADTPKKLMNLDTKTIQELIYPVGFYKRKSETIKNIAKKIHEQYNDKVPDTIDELLKLKGVGRKTANIVITYGHNKEGLAVDVHAHRIPNRIGWIKTKTPEETEMLLRKDLPNKFWIPFNELMVRHGKAICRPISPICSQCPINEYCGKVGVGKSR